MPPVFRQHKIRALAQQPTGIARHIGNVRTNKLPPKPRSDTGLALPATPEFQALEQAAGRLGFRLTPKDLCLECLSMRVQSFNASHLAYSKLTNKQLPDHLPPSPAVKPQLPHHPPIPAPLPPRTPVTSSIRVSKLQNKIPKLNNMALERGGGNGNINSPLTPRNPLQFDQVVIADAPRTEAAELTSASSQATRSAMTDIGLNVIQDGERDNVSSRITRSSPEMSNTAPLLIPSSDQQVPQLPAAPLNPNILMTLSEEQSGIPCTTGAPPVPPNEVLRIGPPVVAKKPNVEIATTMGAAGPNMLPAEILLQVDPQHAP